MGSRASSISLVFARLALYSVWALTCLPAAAHEPEQTTPEPGFRPPSEHTSSFLEAVGDTSMDVLPTIVRRIDRTAHSFASQLQVVQFLNDNYIATARARRIRIDLDGLERGTQWEIFQRGMAAVAAATAGPDAEADYTFVMEILVPGDQEVFGVEVYILDRQGRNAFSYLLNSHHRLFAAAGLVASDSSEAARQRMVESATRAALVALQAQIQDARSGTRRAMLDAPRASAGILHERSTFIVRFH